MAENGDDGTNMKRTCVCVRGFDVVQFWSEVSASVKQAKKKNGRAIMK